SGGPDQAICPAPSRGKYRSAPDHRISSGSRAVHISYRGPPSRREVFRGVGPGRYLSACPGIKESDAGNFEMFGVPRNQRKVVVQGGGSEKPVNNRQRRSPGSCATRESSPAVGDGLIDSKDAVRKPKRQVPVQPGFEGSATLGIGQGTDSFANFAERKHTQIEQDLVRGLDPLRDPRVRPGFDQFGDHADVEQKATHRLIFRPWSALRFKSNSVPASGDAAKNSTRLRGWRVRPVRRSNSSAGTTTTASLPWRVTYCGPSARARRKSSLNRAFAVCNCQGGREGEFTPLIAVLFSASILVLDITSLT